MVTGEIREQFFSYLKGQNMTSISGTVKNLCHSFANSCFTSKEIANGIPLVAAPAITDFKFAIAASFQTSPSCEVYF